MPDVVDVVGSTKYDAFLSYSHEADNDLAPSLQTRVQRLDTSRLRLRSVRIFRDASGLGANPGLWNGIEEALRESRWFVLLASPQAARSAGVQREVAWWLEHRGPQRMIIVATAGSIRWDGAARGFSAETDAVPESLRSAFEEEPRWIDLRPVRRAAGFDLTRAEFTAGVADIAGTLRNIAPDLIAGNEVRRLRRSRQWVTMIAALLGVLALVAGVLALVANHQTGVATAAQRLAAARAMVARSEALAVADPATSLRLATAATSLDRSGDSRASLLRNVVNTSLLGATTGQRDLVVGLAVSTDGTTLATGGIDGSVALWALDGRSPPRALAPSFRSGFATLSAVAMTPDRTTLAVSGTASAATTQGGVELWDIRDPAAPRRTAGPVPGPLGGLSDVAFTPDGAVLAGVGTNEGSVTLWDPSLHPIGTPLTVQQGGLIHLDISSDGRLLATAGLSGGTHLVDLSDRDRPVVVAALPSVGGLTLTARFAPDARLLATAGVDRQVRLWDVSDPARPSPRGVPVAGFGYALDDIAFRVTPGPPVGLQVAVAAADGTTTIVDVTDPTRFEQVATFGGHGTALVRVVFGRAGTTMVTSGGNGNANVWDLDRVDQGDRRVIRANHGQVTWSGFDPSGRTVATAGLDGTVTITDAATARPLLSVPGDATDPPVTGAFLDPGRLVVGTQLGGVATVTAASGVITKLASPHVGRVDVVVASPDRSRIVTGSLDGSLGLWRWDGTALTLQGALPPRTLPSVEAAAITADGRTLIVGSRDRSSRLTTWRLEPSGAPRPLPPLPVNAGDGVGAVAVAAGAPVLATGSIDNAIQLWDLTDPARPTPKGAPLRDLAAGITALALSPDATTLLGASLNGVLGVYDLTAFRLPLLITAPKVRSGSVFSSAFSPTRSQYVYGGQDSTATLVDTAGLDRVRQNPQRRACERAGGPLDPATWAFYAPSIDYEDTCATA